jgi:hypothetical protein
LKIKERTQEGRRVKASSGGFAFGSPAFGHHSIEGQLHANQLETQVVELIRKYHKSGKSFQQIAIWLNTQGYYPSGAVAGTVRPSKKSSNVSIRLGKLSLQVLPNFIFLYALFSRVYGVCQRIRLPQLLQAPSQRGS